MFAAKEQELPLRPIGNQDRDGLWFGEPRQVEKVTVRPVGKLHIAITVPYRRGRYDRHAV